MCSRPRALAGPTGCVLPAPETGASTSPASLVDTASRRHCVLAASSSRSSVHGLFAAAVQQRLIGPGELASAVRDATAPRHRATLLAAVADIAQGAEALSEIDFDRLRRRTGCPHRRV